MRENWLENKLNERFEGMEPQLDLEAAWGTLESRRKRRRKGFYWFWTGAGVLVVGVALLLWPAKEESPTVVTSTDMLPVKEEVPYTALVKTEQNAEENTPQVTAPAVATPIHVVELISPEPTTVESTLLIINPISEPEPELAAEPVAEPVAEPIAAIALPIEKEVPRSVEIRNNSLVQSLPTAVLLLDAELDLPQLDYPLTTIPLAAHPNNGSSWEIGLSGAYGWSFAPDFTTAFSFDEATAIREAVDRWTTGLQLTHRITNRWQVRSGLEYFSFMNRTHGSWKRNFYQMEDGQLVELRQYADGTIVEVFGEADVGVEETLAFSVWETHSGWTVPLEIGYTPILNDRFRVTLSAGAGYSFGMNRKGKRLFDKEYTGEFRETADLPFRNNGLWSARGGVELNYKFGDHLSFQIGLQGGCELNNSQLEGEWFGEKKYSWGLGRLGVVYGL